ncbi:MAG: flagellar motor switch phosphatase FliY [Defluviitaleaceae bacterium]|nr:flagellar motor switch phosphatase FliY [Defluviitaleaceae bacterium]
MGEMLSQEEINALLNGPPPEVPSETSDNAGASALDFSSDSVSDNEAYSNMLTPEQKDVLGEFGNISMGTAATTMSTLLNNKVDINTPSVKIMTWEDLKSRYQRPFVGIRVDYTVGLRGSNIMALQMRDVKIITNLMMGGDGTVTDESEINEIDLSAIGEAMNQMVGSSSTSVSSMLKQKIDIDTPKAFVIDFTDEEFFETVDFKFDEVVVCVYFNMHIGDIIDSQIMQVMNLELAKDVIEMFKNSFIAPSESAASPAAPAPKAPAPAPPAQAAPAPIPAAPPMPYPPQPVEGGYGQPMYGQPMPMQYAPPMPPMPTNVSPAHFQNFDVQSVIQQKENIGIIMDVPLEVTVELGRTRKKIKEILEFSPGTIIELDKLAGEPIDVLVNGKFVAKGEVVVIDEKFGIRITDIINPENRI